MDPENKNKHDFLLELLAQGDAMVCLDPRHPGVDVPAMHKANPMLSLIFNLNFRRPIEIHTDGIQATLAFGGRPHRCFIPFEAVWAIYIPGSQTGKVWEPSIPQDLDLSMLRDKGGAPSVPEPTKDPPPPDAKKPGEAKPKRDRSHLRVIK
ncbi:MAG: ClpXP protease specificity-enhancing factor SspB [Nitrospinaceae bacterium]